MSWLWAAAQIYAAYIGVPLFSGYLWKTHRAAVLEFLEETEWYTPPAKRLPPPTPPETQKDPPRIGTKARSPPAMPGGFR
jgi:hypothetical protein